MRVALVCGTYARDRDGVADYVGVLAEALRDQGASTVIGGAAGSDAGAVELCRRWDAVGVSTAARRLARLRPDVVHVQHAPSAYRFSPAVGLLPPLLRAAGCRAPVVTTLHEAGWWSWPPHVPDAAWRALERRRWWDRESGRLAPGSVAVVTTSVAAAAVVRERLGREPRVVPIGPNVRDAGVDRSTARREVRAELGLPADAVLLAFFGFVHPVKGLRHLLEALAVLRATRPGGERLHLVVVGGFASLALPGAEARAYRQEVEALAEQHGVAEAVRLTGHVPAGTVSRLLAASDAVVLPFTAGVTTKSGSLLTAWDHRLPVVATTSDVPDPEVVDGGTVVEIAARRDAAEVAAAVTRLLDDPALAERVRAGGAAQAAERSWQRIADAHVRLYLEVTA